MCAQQLDHRSRLYIYISIIFLLHKFAQRSAEIVPRACASSSPYERSLVIGAYSDVIGTVRVKHQVIGQRIL